MKLQKETLIFFFRKKKNFKGNNNVEMLRFIKVEESNEKNEGNLWKRESNVRRRFSLQR